MLPVPHRCRSFRSFFQCKIKVFVIRRVPHAKRSVAQPSDCKFEQRLHRRGRVKMDVD